MKTYICSYCKMSGHYINKCNHPSIKNLQDTIKKDAVIQMYCMIKYKFNYLLYSLDLLTSHEIRILLYKNDYTQKISSYPTKIDLQNYYQFLNQIYSFINKDFINIPYIDNTLLWDYATHIQQNIQQNIEQQSVMTIYTDIVKISPRPYCYEIDMQFTDNPIIHFNNDKCSICFEYILKSSICTLNCKHGFCINCIKLYLISLYKYSDETYDYQPNCPLCRTYISTIIVNENLSYIYFQETFFKKFIPDYFDTIDETETIRNHNYDKLFYHRDNNIQVDSYSDDDVQSPYNHPLDMHGQICLFTKLGFMVGKILKSIILINAFIFCKLYNMVKRWMIFVFITNTLLIYNNEIVEMYHNYKPFVNNP